MTDLTDLERELAFELQRLVGLVEFYGLPEQYGAAVAASRVALAKAEAKEKGNR